MLFSYVSMFPRMLVYLENTISKRESIQSCTFSNLVRTVELNILRVSHSDFDGCLIMYIKSGRIVC